MHQAAELPYFVFVYNLVTLVLKMGQVEVTSITDPTLQCQEIGSSPAFRLFRNSKGDQFQKYDIRYNNNDLDFVGKYDHRIKNFHQNIARVYYIGKKGINPKQNESVSNDLDKQAIYEVVIEAVPNRLSDFVALTSQQSLNILLGALKGFHELYKAVGPIVVKDTMIGINRKNEVKVWINSTFPLNYIEQSQAHLKKLPNKDKQPVMLKNIIQLVKQRTSKLPAWLNFVQYWQSTNPSSFAQAIAFTSEFITKNKIYLPNRQNIQQAHTQTPHELLQSNSLSQSQRSGIVSMQQRESDSQKYHQVAQDSQMNVLGNTDRGKQTINFANLRAKAVQHHNLQTSKVIHQEQVRPYRVNSFDNPVQFYSQHSSPNRPIKQGINPFVASIKQVQQQSIIHPHASQVMHTANGGNSMPNSPSLGSSQKIMSNGPTSGLIKRISSMSSEHSDIVFPAPRQAATLVQMNKSTNNIGLQVRKNVSDNNSIAPLSKQSNTNNKKQEKQTPVNTLANGIIKLQQGQAKQAKQPAAITQKQELNGNNQKQTEQKQVAQQKQLNFLTTTQPKESVNQTREGDSSKIRLTGKIAHKISSSSEIKIASILNRNSNAGQIVKRQGQQKYPIKLQLQKVKSQLIENYENPSTFNQNRKELLRPTVSSALAYKNNAVTLIKTIDDSDDEQTSRVKLERSRRLHHLQRSLAESVRLGRSTEHIQLDSSMRSSTSRSISSTFVPVSYRDMKDMLKNIRSKKKPSV